MSLVLTIPQLRESSEGSVPEAFKGKIKQVFQRRPCNNQNGESTMQGLVITGDGAEIDLTLFGREEIKKSDVGKMIYVQAVKGERGFGGTKRKDYAPAGKPVKPQVTVDDRAEITFEGAAQQSAPQQSTANNQTQRPATQSRQATLPRQEAAPSQQPAQGEKSKADLTRAAIAQFNRRLSKSMSALNRCFDAAIKLEKDLHTQYPTQNLQFSATDIKDIAMGLMVNSCWTEKPADVIDFPIKPFSEYAVKATGTDGNAGNSGHPLD